MAKFIFIISLIGQNLAWAGNDLKEMMSQKRCTPAPEQKSGFDCMVDQPDGSVKKVHMSAMKPPMSVKKPSKKDSSVKEK